MNTLVIRDSLLDSSSTAHAKFSAAELGRAEFLQHAKSAKPKAIAYFILSAILAITAFGMLWVLIHNAVTIDPIEEKIPTTAQFVLMAVAAAASIAGVYFIHLARSVWVKVAGATMYAVAFAPAVFTAWQAQQAAFVGDLVMSLTATELEDAAASGSLIPWVVKVVLSLAFAGLLFCIESGVLALKKKGEDILAERSENLGNAAKCDRIIEFGREARETYEAYVRDMAELIQLDDPAHAKAQVIAEAHVLIDEKIGALRAKKKEPNLLKTEANVHWVDFENKRIDAEIAELEKRKMVVESTAETFFPSASVSVARAAVNDSNLIQE